LRQIVVDFEMRKAPGIWRDLANAVLKEALDIAVVLLKMMRPEEQTFRPKDLAGPGHRIPADKRSMKV
jgi:hypothetical protein